MGDRLLRTISALCVVELASTIHTAHAASTPDLTTLQQNVSQSQLTGQNLIVAVIIIVVGSVVANLISSILKKLTKNAAQSPLRLLIIRLIKYSLVFISILLAADTIGLDVGWLTFLVGLLGLMFYLTLKPLIESISAGILLRTQPTFAIGDEVEVDTISGTVIDVSSRTTVIKTYDGQKAHIPNQLMLDRRVINTTAYPHTKSHIDLELPWGTEIAKLQTAIVSPLMKIDNVLDSPAPQLHRRRIDGSGYCVRISWWHPSGHHYATQTTDDVLMVVSAILHKQKITPQSSDDDSTS